MTKSVTAFIAVFVTSSAASAASPEAWQAYRQEVTSSCAKARGLRNARSAGRPVEFDDAVGYTAMVIQGRFPQSHMKNRKTRVLCLFKKQSCTAYIAPADAMTNWTHP